jgi:hypothetical protein
MQAGGSCRCRAHSAGLRLRMGQGISSEQRGRRTPPQAPPALGRQQLAGHSSEGGRRLAWLLCLHLWGFGSRGVAGVVSCMQRLPLHRAQAGAGLAWRAATVPPSARLQPSPVALRRHQQRPAPSHQYSRQVIHTQTAAGPPAAAS